MSKPIIRIEIPDSGPDAGLIDYAIDVALVHRVVEAGRVQELIDCLDAVKTSCTIQDALRKDKLLRDLGAVTP